MIQPLSPKRWRSRFATFEFGVTTPPGPKKVTKKNCQAKVLSHRFENFFDVIGFQLRDLPIRTFVFLKLI